MQGARIELRNGLLMDFVQVQRGGVRGIELADDRILRAKEHVLNFSERDLGGIHAQHHKALAVHSAPAGAAGHLVKVARPQDGEAVAIEFPQRVEDDGAGGHVDAQREGFGGENQFDQTGGEQLLDHLFERRQHAGVVIGDPMRHKAAHPLRGRLIRQIKAPAQVVKALADKPLLDRREKLKVGHFAGELLRLAPAEREVDARQPVGLDQMAHERRKPIGHEHMMRRVLLMPARPVGREAAIAVVLEVFPIVKQKILALKAEVERDDAGGFRDNLGRALQCFAHPGRDFLDVGDRGAEAEELRAKRREDDGLFPDRAAFLIVQIVNFIENDPRDIAHLIGLIKECVAVDLSGHDAHGRPRIDGHIAGEDADVGRIQRGEITILLIAERFDWRGVNDAFAALKRLRDDMIGNHGLARARRCGDEDRHIPTDGGKRPFLKRIVAEGMQRGHRLTSVCHEPRQALPRAPLPRARRRGGASEQIRGAGAGRWRWQSGCRGRAAHWLRRRPGRNCGPT